MEILHNNNNENHRYLYVTTNLGKMPSRNHYEKFCYIFGFMLYFRRIGNCIQSFLFLWCGGFSTGICWGMWVAVEYRYRLSTSFVLLVLFLVYLGRILVGFVRSVSASGPLSRNMGGLKSFWVWHVAGFGYDHGRSSECWFGVGTVHSGDVSSV